MVSQRCIFRGIYIYIDDDDDNDDHNDDYKDDYRYDDNDDDNDNDNDDDYRDNDDHYNKMMYRTTYWNIHINWRKQKEKMGINSL